MKWLKKDGSVDYMYLLRNPVEIDSVIQILEHRAIQCDYDNLHKDNYSNAHARHLHNVKTIDALLPYAEELNIEEYGNSMLIINGKFIVSLANNKWTIRGKQHLPWYKYKSIDSLVEKHIMKD